MQFTFFFLHSYIFTSNCNNDNNQCCSATFRSTATSPKCTFLHMFWFSLTMFCLVDSVGFPYSPEVFLTLLSLLRSLGKENFPSACSGACNQAHKRITICMLRFRLAYLSFFSCPLLLLDVYLQTIPSQVCEARHGSQWWFFFCCRYFSATLQRANEPWRLEDNQIFD